MEVCKIKGPRCWSSQGRNQRFRPKPEVRNPATLSTCVLGVWCNNTTLRPSAASAPCTPVCIRTGFETEEALTERGTDGNNRSTWPYGECRSVEEGKLGAKAFAPGLPEGSSVIVHILDNLTRTLISTHTRPAMVSNSRSDGHR